MDPEITVLMSVYNGERFLREAIESILNQTYRDFEFLIINDGSTDTSREIILSYNDQRIRLIDNEQNIGLTRSLNKGLRLARGNFIARMDADDISYPNRLEEEISVIQRDKGIGMAATWIDKYDSNYQYDNFFKIVNTINSPEEIFYILFFHNCIAHSTVLFNKELVISLGGYDERYTQSQDYDLWIKLSRVSKIVKIKKALVALRSHENGVSIKNYDKQSLVSDEIYLKNILKLFPRKIDQKILIPIRFNSVGISNLIKSIVILDRINKYINKTAHIGIDKDELKICGNNRKLSMIYRSLNIFQ